MNNSSVVFISNSTDEVILSGKLLLAEAQESRHQGLWLVSWLILIEYAILFIRGRKLPSIHENVLSMCHAALYELSKILVRGVEYSAYVYVWKKYALLPSYLYATTYGWIGTIIFIDFCYYWFHRISHEIMVLWAIHQVHHSSEDITVAVGLRHSPLQNLFSWIFYLPMAVLGLPPSHMVSHVQLNLMYQTWIHTTSIDSLGFLENIFNTPSHHRVHHGSIQYCIDVNYGGIFVIWDKLFNTFQAELNDIKIVYGIIIQPHFHNILYHQLFYYDGILEKAAGMSNWTDYFKTFIMGPSWRPGSSRTGRELDSSSFVGEREKVQANQSIFLHMYTIAHLLSASALTCHLVSLMKTTEDTLLIEMIYGCIALAALTNIGMLYEGRPSLRKLEIIRNFASLVIYSTLPVNSFIYQIPSIILHAFSFLLWSTTPPKASINILTYQPEKKVQ